MVGKRGSWQMEDCFPWMETYMHLTMLLLTDLDPRMVKAWELLYVAIVHYLCTTPQTIPATPSQKSAHDSLMQLGKLYEDRCLPLRRVRLIQHRACALCLVSKMYAGHIMSAAPRV